MAETLVLRPQPGYQERMLSTPADIAIGGGAAGAGKTWSLLAEPVRHIRNPSFGAVIFRRVSPMITNEGGLWDESQLVYTPLGGVPRVHKLDWTFPASPDAGRSEGARVKFAQMQYASGRTAWDGAQIPFVGFDQLEQFEEIMFWHMIGRMRTMSGIRPYLRATCNPVPDDDVIGGWLNRLLAWWIDQKTGYPIPSRSGVVRWVMRIADKVEWSDARTTSAARQDFLGRFPQLQKLKPEDIRPKSFTFIPGTLDDNVKLNEKDPDYRANLLLLPLVERERRLGGNWKIKATAGKVFNRTWFKILRELPSDVIMWIRYWDKAGTEGAGKFTAGVLMGLRHGKAVVVADVVRGQWSAGNRERMIEQTALADRDRYGDEVVTWLEMEPGSGGKESAENTRGTTLAGFTVKVERATGKKLVRAGPLASAAEAGNVYVMQFYRDEHANTEAFLSEAQNFDGTTGYMDQVDGSSGAYNKLQAHARGGTLEITTGAPVPGNESDPDAVDELQAAMRAYGVEDDEEGAA